MLTSCGLDCEACPAALRCGKKPNFCRRGQGCADCADDPLRSIELRRALISRLGGLAFEWPRPLTHHQELLPPAHLPVLVQGYTEPVDLPWVALHAGRVLGLNGDRVTPKHRRPLREVYRLAPRTRLALEFYVEDRVLEGFWSRRRHLIPELAEMGFDLVLAPGFSVWRDASRLEQISAQRRSTITYFEMRERDLPAVPDVAFSFFEPDGRLHAEWINRESELRAISIFCGGKRIHAELRAHRETVDDLALFHRAVRPEVTFILGGIHSPARLAEYRRAMPGRRLLVCNAMAYSLAQRRRLLAAARHPVARSARGCFLANCAHNAGVYAELLGEEVPLAV